MSSSTEVREMSSPITGRPMPPRALLAARRCALEQRWAAGGVAALADGEAFALLCGVDAGVGEDLLVAFGSVPEVWGAAEADLARVAGPRAAAWIKLAQEVARRVLARPLKQRNVLGAWTQVADHLRTAMVGAPREQFFELWRQAEDDLFQLQRLGLVGGADAGAARRGVGDQGRADRPAPGLVAGGVDRHPGQEGAGIADLGMGAQGSDVGLLGEVLGLLRTEAPPQEGDEPIPVVAVEAIHRFEGVPIGPQVPAC
jgi:hypothetical protein